MAKNKGVIDAVQQKISVELMTFPESIDPQIIGALGAALIARDHARKKAEE